MSYSLPPSKYFRIASWASSGLSKVSFAPSKRTIVLPSDLCQTLISSSNSISDCHSHSASSPFSSSSWRLASWASRNTL